MYYAVTEVRATDQTRFGIANWELDVRSWAIGAGTEFVAKCIEFVVSLNEEPADRRPMAFALGSPKHPGVKRIARDDSIVQSTERFHPLQEPLADSGTDTGDSAGTNANTSRPYFAAVASPTPSISFNAANERGIRSAISASCRFRMIT
jgi:hypothetical protein